MGTVAAAVTAPPSSTPSALPAGSIVQVMISLAAVLALVGAAAWLLKRFSSRIGRTGSGPIRIISGTSVGQRERIVLVEVANTWLLVGVAPGQVRTLHVMPKLEANAAPEAPEAPDASFVAWLGRVTERRKHG